MIFRLAGKALEQGKRVLVHAPDQAEARRVDQMLWSIQPTGFLAHCLADHRLAAVTPLLVGHAEQAAGCDEVLLNLCPEVPAFFSRFERLLEIVTTDEQDRQYAQQRWRFYKDRGYPLDSHRMDGARHG
jgi:DNA polymerase-3 subunit chi